ncbi:conserved hypothetical protein [Culex quinquefasciatus]|uniref:Uncharacterized protein n=1 Tax=Culex quinquefasciatus TaxID=7176 RepID=B0W1R8_CULQU|nr:conserved hypothetical protein [Culex quinquefasciatus]|eukprot:XP_001842652.1 conserved hypothetical protein [Culex quinquefasciatus]
MVGNFLKSKVTTTPFNKDILNPFDRKQELGHHELLERGVSLKKILASFDNSTDQIEFTAAKTKLQPVSSVAFIAVEECALGRRWSWRRNCSVTGRLDVIRQLFVTTNSRLKQLQFIAITNNATGISFNQEDGDDAAIDVEVETELTVNNKVSRMVSSGIKTNTVTGKVEVNTINTTFRKRNRFTNDVATFHE